MFAMARNVNWFNRCGSENVNRLAAGSGVPDTIKLADIEILSKLIQTCRGDEMNLRSAMAEGGKARIKSTGQVVKVKRWSSHGIAVVEFSTGGEYFLPAHKLVPVAATTAVAA